MAHMNPKAFHSAHAVHSGIMAFVLVVPSKLLRGLQDIYCRMEQLRWAEQEDTCPSSPRMLESIQIPRGGKRSLGEER